MMKRSDEDRARMAMLYEAGFSTTEIGEREGLSGSIVSRELKRAGVKLSRDVGGERNPNWRGGRIIRHDGYAYRKMPDHPRAATGGYVREHIVVMEDKLGRPLVWKGSGHPESEIVHHIDGDKANNDPANLEITTWQEHAYSHARERARLRLFEAYLAGACASADAENLDEHFAEWFSETAPAEITL